MVEHDGFWTVLSGKISSDKIINNDMWVMNTFWTRNARNLPWEKLTKASVPPHALCYSPFCCLGRFYPFRGHGENHQQSQNQDLYSLGCSTVCYKRVKTCFLLVLFCTEWRDAFFFFVTMTKYPIADFWSSCFKTFRSIWFAVCTTLLPAHFVRWLFFFSTHHNRAEPKRCPESTSVFIYKEWRGKSGWYVSVFIETSMQSSPFLFWDTTGNVSRVFSNIVWCFVFPPPGDSASRLPRNNITNCSILMGQRVHFSSVWNISTDDLSLGVI